MAYDNFGNFIPNSSQYQMGQNSYNYQRTMQQNTYAFVNGIEGAKSYIVPANQTVLLMDSEQPICYMKQANSLGQGSLRYFKLDEISEQKARELTQPKEAGIYSNYVTKLEFDSLSKKLDEVISKLTPASEEKTNG